MSNSKKRSNGRANGPSICLLVAQPLSMAAKDALQTMGDDAVVYAADAHGICRLSELSGVADHMSPEAPMYIVQKNRVSYNDEGKRGTFRGGAGVDTVMMTPTEYVWEGFRKVVTGSGTPEVVVFRYAEFEAIFNQMTVKPQWLSPAIQRASGRLAFMGEVGEGFRGATMAETLEFGEMDAPPVWGTVYA